MPKENLRLLVTGAGGFIGSHVAETLVQQGHRVTALVHYNAQRYLGNLHLLATEVLASMDIVPGDINDPEAVAHVVEGHDIILHLAALIGIPYSYRAPRSYLQTNAEGTLNLLEASRKHGLRRFVYISTSEVYGSARQIPIDEQHPFQAQSPYSASKIAAETLVEAYYRNFSVPAITIRPFNTFGPRQSARAIIPTIISQVLKEDALCLGRTDTIRDFTYVDDTVAGIVAAALTENLGMGPYNLGTGTGRNIGEVAAQIMAQTGRSIPITEDNQRLRPEAGEVDRLISDNRKFKEATAWKPQVEFEEGLRRTIEFWRHQVQLGNASLYTI